MTQCDTCKHALVERMPTGKLLVFCRHPRIGAEDTDAQACAGYEQGAPVRRYLKGERHAD